MTKTPKLYDIWKNKTKLKRNLQQHLSQKIQILSYIRFITEYLKITFCIGKETNYLKGEKSLRSEIFVEFNFAIHKMKFSNFAEFKEFSGQKFKLF